MKSRTYTFEELDAAAAEALLAVRAQASAQAACIALHGTLGAGKTSLTQAIARRLGVAEDVTSPTFVIEKRYETTDPELRSLVHIDAYRLDTPQELAVLGFADTLNTPHTLVVVEWAERVAELLPPHTLHLTLEHAGEGARSIAYA